MSNQTLRKWWTDSLTVLAVSCVGGGLFLWVPYLLLRKSPRRWWLYTAGMGPGSGTDPDTGGDAPHHTPR